MNDSNSSSNPAPPRTTLKLKVAPRRAPEERKAPPATPAPSKSKPGAHWSDEYKQQMQADMDKLVSR
jgi:hypothetical protein